VSNFNLRIVSGLKIFYQHLEERQFGALIPCHITDIESSDGWFDRTHLE